MATPIMKKSEKVTMTFFLMLIFIMNLAISPAPTPPGNEKTPPALDTELLPVILWFIVEKRYQE
jgi:hypothetical protein